MVECVRIRETDEEGDMGRLVRCCVGGLQSIRDRVKDGGE